MKMMFVTSRPIQRGRSMGVVGLVLLLLVLASCGGGSQSTTPTPTPTGTITFTTFSLRLPPEALNAPVKGPLPDDTPMHVAITFKTNGAVLDKLNKTGKGTNLEDSANQLGISDATYQKIKDLFGVTNATLKLDGLHTYLTIDAKAKTFALAFQTTFVQRQLNGRTFYTPTGDPKIPTFIAPQVLAITGLDNYAPPPQAGFVRGKAATRFLGRQQLDDCSDTAAVMQIIAHIYGYDQLWKQGWHGEGMTVYLTELGPISQDNLQTYGKCVHFQGKITPIDVNGGPDPNNPADAGNEGEAMLDVEMLQGLAPAANIVDYQTGVGQGDGWEQINDTLRAIIKDNEKNTPAGSIVSVSYGGDEQGPTPDDRDAIDESLKILNQAEHMTVFVATGDCAAFGGRQYNSLAVDYPAISPWSVAVGGTKLSVDNNGNRASEVAWSDGSDQSKCTNQWGSGGGNSTIYSRPDWQKADGLDNQYSQGKRQTPDISAVAYGLPVYDKGQWGGANGTSAATPIWAAGFALVNQGLIAQTQQFVNGPETFYDVASNKGDKHPYYDVTQGSNLHYPATPGWDYATGLGTPNLGDFFAILVNLVKQS